jgi:hypothetical protein
MNRREIYRPSSSVPRKFSLGTLTLVPQTEMINPIVIQYKELAIGGKTERYK